MEIKVPPDPIPEGGEYDLQRAWLTNLMRLHPDVEQGLRRKHRQELMDELIATVASMGEGEDSMFSFQMGAWCDEFETSDINTKVLAWLQGEREEAE
jgi:hypothetical protein